jgi:hypothetical protein
LGWSSENICLSYHLQLLATLLQTYYTDIGYLYIFITDAIARSNEQDNRNKLLMNNGRHRYNIQCYGRAGKTYQDVGDWEYPVAQGGLEETLNVERRLESLKA